MASFTESAAVSEILPEERKFAVLAQLERILASPFFNHSRRFPAFLRYIVHATVNGQAELLKERTIGVEIFGKVADYDTALDPIVRVTAGEVRKRIAQYYQEPGHEREPRLSLPPGAYIPQFQFPDTAIARPEPLAKEVTEEGSESAVEGQSIATRPRHFRSRWLVMAVAAAAVIGASAYLFYLSQNRSSGFADFWGPFLNSPDPILFCIADQTKYTAISLRDAADPSRQVTLQDNLTAVVIDDLSPITKIAGVLQSSGKHYSLRGEDTTSLMDLRNGPSIVIGAYDNAWTLRMLRPLRFHFANNPEMTLFSIVDSTQPNKAQWVLDRRKQVATNSYRDFAIVARFTDEITGKPTLIAAGIARGGTIAAGEFVTNSTLLDEVRRQQPSPKAKNVEVVLSTEIINGEPGTPSIEAVYYW